MNNLLKNLIAFAPVLIAISVAVIAFSLFYYFFYIPRNYLVDCKEYCGKGGSVNQENSCNLQCRHSLYGSKN